MGIEIDNNEYHTGEGISHSALQVLRKDPREYKYRYIDGNYDRERKDYFDFGNAVHEMALLGSSASIKLIPENVLSASGSKAGKLWKEFESEHRGSLLLKQNDFDSVCACVEAIYEHPLASRLLACDGPAEHAFYHDDELLGLKLKCKPDKLAITPHGTVVIDLKTTDNVSTKAFVNSIVNYHYDCQQYFYSRVLRAIGHDVADFVFVAVQKTAPFCVNCFSINGQDMTTAAELVERALSDLAERQESGDWQPKNYGSVTKVSLPKYSQYRGEE